MAEDADWPATPRMDWDEPEKEQKAVIDPVCSVERIGATVYHLSDSKPTTADASGDQGDDEQDEEEEDEEEQDQEQEDEEYEYDEADLEKQQ